MSTGQREDAQTLCSEGSSREGRSRENAGRSAPIPRLARILKRSTRTLGKNEIQQSCLLRDEAIKDLTDIREKTKYHPSFPGRFGDQGQGSRRKDREAEWDRGRRTEQASSSILPSLPSPHRSRSRFSSERRRSRSRNALHYAENLLPGVARSRGNVQRGATAVFKTLVKDEAYDGIEIDENYLVRPIDSAGKVQTAPSSGGQQLLTLALIAGLNSTAVHDAPIVMDTPFGRLDVGNRERILRWVNRLVRSEDQQVILMFHSGEVNREDLRTWGDRSGAIIRDHTGASTSARHNGEQRRVAMKGDTADLKQVGVTDYANEQLGELVGNQEYFDNEQDVYRLCVALAIALRLPVSEGLRKQETRVKWRVADDVSDEGSQGSRLDDPSGTLAKMVAVFRPEYATEPYRYSQYLASMGINYLHGRLFEKGESLQDALLAISDKASTQGKDEGV